MKVLHLVAGELNGGAARGAYWLHQALCEIGVDSKILTTAKDDLGDESVISLTNSLSGKLNFAIRRRLGQLPIKTYGNRKSTTFNTGFDGFGITSHPAYAAADLVHLHWVNGMVSTKMLRKLKKPVVWTLRDMWPFTGGCHQSMDCDRYTNDCGSCPQLGSTRERDLTRFILRRKKASLPEHLRIVGISQWMSERARESTLFRERDVTTISNNVDTRLFSPLPRKSAREVLGFDDNEKVVLVGAQDISSVYKGFDLFLEALKSLADKNLRVVLLGNASGVIPELPGVTIESLGSLSDPIALRLAYSAADVFAAPSRADAFGKMLVESMSCETPVVCFDATGPKDIVEHRVSGYLAEPFSPLDFAQGIRWVLERSAVEYAELCRSARERAQQKFDTRVIAKEYLELYRDALQGAKN
jgi:glycosyltransferase involved in cell wall biosynthesis